MKKLLFSIFFVAGFIFFNKAAAQDFFSTKIGELENGVPVITYDLGLLKQEWQSFLFSNSNLTVVFSSVVISQEESQFILRGNNANNTTKSAIELVKIGNDFHVQRANGVVKTVTCTGCTSGCSPAGDANGWHCKDPCEDCVKTESLSF